MEASWGVRCSPPVVLGTRLLVPLWLWSTRCEKLGVGHERSTKFASEGDAEAIGGM